MTDDIKIDGDVDIGVGGIDRFNSETGKTEVIRPSELGEGKPFTIEDYNQALEEANELQKKQSENIMSDDVKQVKRADTTRKSWRNSNCNATKSCSQYDALSVSC